MKFYRSQVAILAGLLAVVLACGPERGNGTEQLQEITVGTFSRAIDYSPYYVARHFGWFEDALEGTGISVRYQEFGDRDSISAAMENDQLHVLFAAAPPVIITRAQGNDPVICELSCTLQQEIVTQRSLPVSSAADLRGLRIAVLQGTGSHFGLEKTLDSFGIGQDEVRMHFMPPPDAAAAFEAQEIDAWAVWPPFVEEQVLAGNGRVVAGGDAIIQSVVTIGESFGETNRSTAMSMTDVVRQAKSWILANPDEAQVIVARAVNLDPEVVELAWGKHDWAARLGPSIFEDLKEKTDFLRDKGLLRRGAPENLATQLYTTDFGGDTSLP